MEKTETEEETSINSNEKFDEVMAQLIKDAEDAIEDVGEEIKRELKDEILIIRDQFEKKKKQIIEKAKKDVGNRTSMISEKIKETLIHKIEQMSTSKISQALEQADHEIEDLVKWEDAPQIRANRKVPADETPEPETYLPHVGDKNLIEDKNKDEIEISTINMEDETESKENIEDWFTQ